MARVVVARAATRADVKGVVALVAAVARVVVARAATRADVKGAGVKGEAVKLAARAHT
jgi:hypothetical protein